MRLLTAFLVGCFSLSVFAQDFEKPKKGINALAALPDYRVEIPKELNVAKAEYKDVYRSKMGIPNGGYAWCGKVKDEGEWRPFVVNRITDGRVSAFVYRTKDANDPKANKAAAAIAQMAWSLGCMSPID